MKRGVIFLAVCIAAIQATSVFGAFNPQNFFDAEVIIPKEEKIETDLRILAGNVIIEGDVTGRVCAAGGNILISSEIGELLEACGGNVEFSGTANEDARVYGANVEITGRVKGKLSGTAVKLVLSGTFDDEVEIYGGKVEINGTFAKGLVLYAQEARLGPETVIEGDFEYSVEKKLDKDPDAKIMGETRDITEETKKKLTADLRRFNRVFTIFLFIGFIVTGLIFQGVFPRYFKRVSDNMSSNFPQSMLVGFLSIVGVPIAVFILCITVIGIPSALILSSLYFIALYLSFIFAGTFVGRLIIGAISNRGESPLLLCMFVGLIAIFLISLISRIGPLLMILLAIAGFGSFVIGLYKKEPPAIVAVDAKEKSTTDESSTGRAE